MHILKLPWFGHKAENKQIECYSVSINSNGSRLASGGLDGNVKIWDTKSILYFKNYEAEPETKNNKNGINLDTLNSDIIRRPLCSMSRHNGVVTSVKFSPDGRFLASGSDDKIVLIWEKDEEQANRPKQFGEAEADLEHWTVRKRLVAHDNDIQDICWSPDGSLLVTVGLDRLIIIWNGLTFERIKRYDIHQSMVKGIVFDPANKFFATASDDRSVRIFRYYRKLSELSINNYEFQMEHIVIDPFKKSPLTSYFRRMSWSPDGQHIAVPNATNGPVTSVAIINRTNWGTDISLIGHEAPCEVCCFSPRLFEYDDGNDSQKKNQNGMGNFTTILATAGQDQNLVVWTTRQSKPLVVAHDIVSGSITDMCWAPDGQTLYFSCLDGSITCVSFENNELGKVVSENMNDLQLHRYGADRESATFPESVEQLLLEEKSEATEHKENKKLAITKPPTTILKSRPEEVRPKEVSPKINNLTPKQVNKLTQSITITKNGKKRVAPLLVSSSSKSSVPVLGTSGKVTKKFQIGSKLSQTSYFLPRLGVLTSVQGFKLKNLVHEFNQSNEVNNDDQDNDNEDMGIDSAKVNDNTKDSLNQSSVSEATLRRQRNKIKRAILETRYPSCFQLISTLPDNLFNNQAILNCKVNQILNNNFNSTRENNNEIISGSSIDAIDEDLIFSVIVTGIQSIEDPSSIIINEAHDTNTSITSIVEVRNGPSWKVNEDDITDFEYGDRIDFQDPTRVIVSNDKNHSKRSYTLFFPYKVQHVLPIIKNKILTFYVLASFNGTIQIILAKSGKYVAAGMEIGNNIILLKQGGDYLMCVTNQGLIYVWKLPNLTAERFLTGVVRGISMAPILNNMVEVPSIEKKNLNKRHANIPQLMMPNVRKLDVDPRNGSPLAILEDNNEVYKFSLDLMVWIKVVDPWYFLALTDSSVDSYKTGNCFDLLLHKSYKSFEEDVKRSKIGLYIFNNSEETNELQKVMKARFKQSMELAGQIA